MTALVDVSVLRWLPAVEVDLAAARVAVAGLTARVPGSVLDVNVSSDGRAVSVQVVDVAALSIWFDLFGRAAGGTSSRDGGGMAWHVRLTVPELPGVRIELTAVSGEFEVLPRTALVRAMCPWMPHRWAVEDREAAAWARRAA
ncbi:hypothetical protein [Kitasatospora sp. NPDC057738]|uniref:hypothetical protein n=1 Tax=Kitasatospora sp. NPDC057738 TaxID=3346233 RepID=UPI0036CE61C3